MSKPINEVVQFRLLHMPCCKTLICWVNPRRPNYCPECGERVYHVFQGARWQEQQSEATLRVEDYDKATWVMFT